MKQNGGRGRNQVTGGSPNHAPLVFPGYVFSVLDFNDVATIVRRPAGESTLYVFPIRTGDYIGKPNLSICEKALRDRNRRYVKDALQHSFEPEFGAIGWPDRYRSAVGAALGRSKAFAAKATY